MCFVSQTNYFIIPSQTSFWACNGKRKESKATVFCGNLIHEECWRCGNRVPPPFAPHPLAVTVQWDGVTAVPVWDWGGWLVDLGSGWWIWMLAGFPQALARAAFTHGVLAAGTKWSCYPSKTAGLCVEGLPWLHSLASFCLPFGSKTLEIYLVRVLP